MAADGLIRGLDTLAVAHFPPIVSCVLGLLGGNRDCGHCGHFVDRNLTRGCSLQAGEKTRTQPDAQRESPRS